MEGDRNSFTLPSLIEKKRDGNALTEQEVCFIVQAVKEHSADESQIGAFLMAVYLQGMTIAETTALTKAMMHSGNLLSWPNDWITVDKHSTGGVGDKTSLPLSAALAVCGLKVPMISGRGLGHTGGTLDKLESIPGFQVHMSLESLRETLEKIGCFIAGQTENLCPVDKVLYAIRDVTSTVSSLPLACSSILSKKVAEGLTSLMLDVKFGSAALFPDINVARKLAQIMVSVGNDMGVRTVAVLSDMNNPLGKYIGNSLEVAECFECMKGGKLLHLNGITQTEEEGIERIKQSLCDGSALDKFCCMLLAQGVSSGVVEKLKIAQNIDEVLNVLPRANFNTTLLTPTNGYVKHIDALTCGKVSGRLGAGRTKAGMPIDHAVGLELHVDIGQYVEAGEKWVTIHHNAVLPDDLESTLQKSINISADTVPQGHSLITEILDNNNNTNNFHELV